MKRIVIVGGGTAGWMCAISFSARMPDTEIVVIDPAAIAPIGVGESVTGVVQMFVRDPLHKLDQAEFFCESDATLKYGIWYKDWQGAGTEYLTPIDGPHDRFVKAYPSAVEDFFALASADNIRLGEALYYGQLMRSGLTDYLYTDDRTITGRYSQGSCHFDAVHFAAWLKRIAPDRENVIHVDDVLESFEMDENRRFVTKIITKGGQSIEGDFFVDCTGFRRALLAKAYEPNWIDYAKYIKVDRAIPCPVGYAPGEVPPNYSQATAARHGWMWQVPTRSRLGKGYLYSSKYTDDADALAEMRSAGLDPGDDPRVIRFEPGKYAEQWIGNVCAVGLAGGFIEALEASTIHGMYVQIELLSELYLPHYRPPAAEALARRYNELIQAAYDDYVDFISFHYHAGRGDSDFWRDYQKPASITGRNAWRMEKWRHAYPTREDFAPMATQRSALTTGLVIWAPMLCALGYLRQETAQNYLRTSRQLDKARANVVNYIQHRQQMLQRGVPHEEALRFVCGS